MFLAWASLLPRARLSVVRAKSLSGSAPPFRSTAAIAFSDGSDLPR